MSARFGDCYNPASRQGRFSARPAQWMRPVDHLSANRGIAFRAVAWQALISALTGLLAWGLVGGNAGLAALIGGSSLAFANAAAAQLALGGGVQTPRAAYARLLLGTILKWVLVVGMWLGAMDVLKRAPLAAILGLLASMATHPVAILFVAKVKRER